MFRDSQGDFQKKQRLCLHHIYKQHCSPIPLVHCLFLTPLTKNCAFLRVVTRRNKKTIVRQYTVFVST